MSSILGAAVAPFIAVALWQSAGGSTVLVGLYLSGAGVITLVALLLSSGDAATSTTTTPDRDADRREPRALHVLQSALAVTHVGAAPSRGADVGALSEATGIDRRPSEQAAVSSTTRLALATADLRRRSTARELAVDAPAPPALVAGSRRPVAAEQAVHRSRQHERGHER